VAQGDSTISAGDRVAVVVTPETSATVRELLTATGYGDSGAKKQ